MCKKTWDILDQTKLQSEKRDEDNNEREQRVSSRQLLQIYSSTCHSTSKLLSYTKIALFVERCMNTVASWKTSKL